MLLAVDIGNTSIKFGLFDDNRLTSKFSIPTNRNSTTNDLKGSVADRLRINVESVIVCSVVPEIDRTVHSFLATVTGAGPVFVDNSFDFGFKINYTPLESLGTDRLVNAFAAVEKLGAPVIVCSMGTATTIDVVNADREFVGGLIAPGMEAMREGLHSKAPRLPMVEVDAPAPILGNTTKDSIRSGLYHGYVAMVEGLLARVRSKSGVVKVVCTGGNAERLADEFAGMMEVDSDLMLEGLNSLALNRTVANGDEPIKPRV